MEMHLTNLVPGQIIKALCNTLIHSLWQGVILAIVTGITILLTKKSSAALRYRLMLGYLLLFSTAIAFTFYKQLPQHIPPTLAQGTTLSAVVAAETFSNSQPKTEKPVNLIAAGLGYFDSHADTIVLIWFLIICARCVQFAIGLQGTCYLRRTKVTAVGAYWENKLGQLANNMAIERVVTILQSGIAQMPMVIGHFKPVILIPVGLLNSLSTEEVEAILLHELAHIRRKDYLVNLLQNLVEIIFFFNPAVLWVSALIKTERENCCDDIVVAQTSSKTTYIKALVVCEEYRSASPAFAMGLGGGNGHVLLRVKRMLHSKNQSLNRLEKMALTGCLILAIFVTAAFSKDKKHYTSPLKFKNHKPLVANTITPPENRPAPAQRISDIINNPGNAPALNYKATIKNADTVKIKKQGRQAADSSTAQQVALLQDKLIKLQLQHTIDSAKLAATEYYGHDDLKPGISYENTPPKVYEYYASNDNGYREKSAKIGDQLIRDNLVRNKTHFTYHINNHELTIDGVKQPEELYRRIVAEYFKPGDGFDINYVFKDPGLNGDKRTYPANQDKRIIDEMARDGLVNYRGDVSFTLTAKTFVINGVAQSDEVFQRYRQEYVPADAGDSWNWNYSGPGSYPSNSYRSRDWEAYSRQTSADRRRVDDERDKKLVADLLQDGLITDPDNVTFSLSEKGMTVNGKKQSDAMYQKYMGKYEPNTSGDSWSWTYSHHK